MRPSSFTTALFGNVVLEMAVYFENQDADVRISENKDLTPNKRINVSSIFGLLNGVWL